MLVAATSVAAATDEAVFSLILALFAAIELTEAYGFKSRHDKPS